MCCEALSEKGDQESSTALAEQSSSRMQGKGSGGEDDHRTLGRNCAETSAGKILSLRKREKDGGEKVATFRGEGGERVEVMQAKGLALLATQHYFKGKSTIQAPEENPVVCWNVFGRVD